MKLTWKVGKEANVIRGPDWRAFVLLELFGGRVRVGVGVPKVDRNLYGLAAMPFVIVRP